MVAHGPPFRLLPRLDDDNRFFWTSGADGTLRFLRCQSCESFIHPPAPRCPYCLAEYLRPEPVSGLGTVSSFTVNIQQWIPGSEPYIIAWVTIAEQDDVRLTTNLVNCAPDIACVGMRVTVAFVHRHDVWYPVFMPTDAV